MTMKFFRKIFAVNGDVQAVSDNAAGDGTVSYDEGYTVPYELLQSDPEKKNVEREKLNQILKDITTSLQLWQTVSYPEFITSAMNNGSAYPYKKDAFVRGDGHSGDGIYVSLEDDNEATLADATKWAKFNPLLDSLPVGTVIEFELSTLPARFLWANGQTIGNASSNATARANADTFSLFKGIWESYSNAARPILTSAGAASTRGVSAQADFDANKQLPLPDRRHRVAIGFGKMGGVSSPALVAASDNGINGDTLGAVGGEGKHALTGDQNGPHNHRYLDDNNIISDIGNGTSATVNGSPIFVSSNTGIGTVGTVGLCSIVNTVNSGQGAAHNNIQPSIVTNFIVKY